MNLIMGYKTSTCIAASVCDPVRRFSCFSFFSIVYRFRWIKKRNNHSKKNREGGRSAYLNNAHAKQSRGIYWPKHFANQGRTQPKTNKPHNPDARPHQPKRIPCLVHSPTQRHQYQHCIDIKTGWFTLKQVVRRNDHQ